NNSSVFINKTGSGNLLELQNNGIDAFVVNGSGQITTGTIDYSQVQGAPATVVTNLGGDSGAINVGTGLSESGNTLSNIGVTDLGGSTGSVGVGTGLGVAGNTLSNTGVTELGGSTGSVGVGTGLSVSSNTITNSGVVDISGTANQVIASASSGSITLSLPQDIATTSSPTFDNQTLNGGLTVAGSAALNGGATADQLTVTGGTTLEGASTADSTLSVQGGLTVGVPGSAQGNLYLSNATNNNSVDLVGEAPSGSGTATIQFPTVAGGSTYTVCVQGVNCGANPNTVSTSSSGTNGTIAEFTGADTIANSSITDNGTTVTVGEPLTDSTINATTIQSSGGLTITPGGTLTAGATNQTLTLQGNSSSSFAISANGYTDTLNFTAPTTASHTVTLPDATGTVCLEGSVSCGFAGGGSGVTSLDTLSGALAIDDTTGSGSAITIQSASTTQAGLAEFSSSDFQVLGGNIIDTIQGISSTSDVQFDSLALDYGGTCTAGGNLCLNSSATINAANITNDSTSGNLNISGGSNNIMFSNDGGANTFELPTTGGTGQQFCTTGITCASGGGQAIILEPGTGSTSAVQDASSNRNSIFIDKTGGTGDLVDLQTGASLNALVIDGSGNATFSNTTTAGTLDVTGTLQADTITPNSSLTVGSTSQQFTLQGTQSSEIEGVQSGNSTFLGFGTPTGNTITAGSIYYALDNSAATNTSSTPYYLCTTAGNCSGTGGSVTALSG
ncbi:MAG TPA: hypothetical protein VGF75_03020, partial [Candidatus Saccharimonadales bacterium]